MSVLIYRDPKTVGAAAATLIASHLITDQKFVFGADYHEMLLPVYDSLSAMTENGLLNWDEAHVYQLFEFLPDENGEQRIANLLGKALFAATDISDRQYSVPFSASMPPEITAEVFEQSILDDGGLDAALIAVRHDGSLLMNRSADSDPETHVVRDEEDGFITVGLSALMQAKHPIVVATGRNSSEAVKHMLQGTITESPMAALRLHPGATFLLDEEAAELL